MKMGLQILRIRTTTKKQRRMRIVTMWIVRKRIARMMTMMMRMTMIPDMRELKIRVKKRNYPVCNRLFSISR